MVSRCFRGGERINLLNQDQIITASRKEILFIFIYAVTLALLLPLGLTTILFYAFRIILPPHIAGMFGGTLALIISGFIVILLACAVET